MTGSILLAGGAEFQPGMEAADRRAITLAGGPAAPIRVIPAAAAPDNNHGRAGANGVRWFRGLGATDVAAVPLTDAASAADRSVVAELRAARLIYLLGGFPRHLGDSLAGSPAWEACRSAYAAGAVIAGSSAGAMVLCAHYFDPQGGEVVPGLGLVPGACVLPHHNGFGASWAPRLAPRLPDVALLGIDERTGLVGTPGADGATAWRVHGPGSVTIYRGGARRSYPAGAELAL